MDLARTCIRSEVTTKIQCYLTFEIPFHPSRINPYYSVTIADDSSLLPLSCVDSATGGGGEAVTESTVVDEEDDDDDGDDELLRFRC